MISPVANFISRAVVQGIPLLCGSTGEIITEKSGNLNLGIPGIMYVGAVSGVAGAFFHEKLAAGPLNPFLAVVIPLVCSLLGSLAMSLIYAFLTVTLRANQNVTGLALTTFGIGLGNFYGGSLAILYGEGGALSLKATSDVFRTALPFAKNLGSVGLVLFSYGWLAYASIVIAVIATFVIKRTRIGLNLRAVGESPATADAAGINVTRYKYGATCIGGMIAGLGGLYFIMDYTSGIWSNGGFGDRGWLAIALVIFAIWNPDIGILGSILFGGLYIIDIFIPNLTRSQQELFKMLPYIVTVIVLIFTSIRRKRETMPPQALGLSYFREER
ncbi:MAG: ABC transporter permease [Clostridia bacterium]|nr:ABC transporter permease [Clostridia bacterium]